MDPGFHFQPTDQEILFYLWCYVFHQLLLCGFIVEGDLRYFQVEQAPDVRIPGSLGRLYYYTDCFYKVPGRPTRERRTVDERGFWKSRNGQTIIYENGLIAGYKQDFKFHLWEAGEAVSTTRKTRKAVPTSWIKTEYTLYSNSSDDNRKAVCILRNTREG